ncbi:hypothetical protein C464_08670 [Halorubrum coriense DSM 10284]|uniref:Uncharacterized protein n=1 Tax=Halorubrum coriense DSM 10284 TaxID=1227466 RepID=M0EI97_9EURY|nr:hypothetical protein C464_08670 [Halorubrum coriense DSM 10284]
MAALLLLATAGFASAPVDARAPPTPVCGVCDLDQPTPSGERVTAGESSLTVTVHANESTTWRARARLATGADALAANDTLRRAVAVEAAGDGIASPSDVDARLDGEALAVEYRDPDAARRSLGAVVFTPLTPASPDMPMVSGGEGTRYLAADRLTVRAGPGLDVRGSALASPSDDGLVWTSNATGDAARPSLGVESDPVAVPEGAVAPGVRAWVARLLVGNAL